MKSSFLTRDKSWAFWSGSTDLKTLDYQRTNPREYQIVRTHTRKPLEYKTGHRPITSSTLCRMPHLNKKQNKNTNPIISRQDYHLTQPCPSEEKQTNKNSAQISPYTKLTQTTGPTLEGRNQKEGIQPWSLGKVKVKSLSHVWLFATLWTVACQAPLSMGFSRLEY